MAPAVLFDLFETLMTEMQDSSAPYPPPWGAPGIELGMGHDCFRRGWTTRKARRMTSTLSYEDALEEICRECGVDPPMDKIHALNESRQAARLRAFLAVPQPVLMMLEELRRQGFRIVVVSNCSVEEAAHFEASPLSGRVDDVVWSFREGVQKPDPQIFCVPARPLVPSRRRPSSSVTAPSTNFGAQGKWGSCRSGELVHAWVAGAPRSPTTHGSREPGHPRGQVSRRAPADRPDPEHAD